MKINRRRLNRPATLDALPEMIEFIRTGALKYGFNDENVETINLAAEEILVNIISYAYSPGIEGTIEISYTFDKSDGFHIEVVDQGVAFDPLELEDPDIDAALEDRKGSGLGIFLVRQIMDKVEYSRENDKNILSFTKY